jgi:hypothetical protein
VSGSSRRYEVNLGMQTFASGAVQWELGVENLGESPLREPEPNPNLWP